LNFGLGRRRGDSVKTTSCYTAPLLASSHGPHPRPVVADRLRVSISGLSRAGTAEPLTTARIVALKEEQPEWLRRERGTRAEAQRAEARLRAERSGRRAQSAS
jgi:hypothetical protein